MQIKSVMTTNPTWLPTNATIQQAAQKMQELNCGFIPVGENEKLTGVITDRDIATRAVAKGKSADTPVTEVYSDKVLYCLETDTIDDVVQNMKEQQIRRLIVLNNKKDWMFCSKSGPDAVTIDLSASKCSLNCIFFV